MTNAAIASDVPLLASQALLVKLTISLWGAQRGDRKATETVASTHKTTGDAGRFMKLLVPKAALDPVSRAASRARQRHYQLTLPWADEGWHILSVAAHQRYVQELSVLHGEFETAIAGFIAGYPAAKAQARQLLGDLFDDTDYPSAAELRTCFSLSFRFKPVPIGNDFRVNLPERELARIKAELTADAEAASRIAMGDLYGRLAGVVSAMAERLRDPEAVFRDSLVTNIRRLCEIVDELNFTGDRTLRQLAADVGSSLAPLDPEQLRIDPKARKAAAAEAERQLELIQQAMRSFTGEI